MIRLFLPFLVLLTMASVAQESPHKNLRSASSPKGNYLFLRYDEKSDSLLRPGDRFKIRRAVYDTVKQQWSAADLKFIGEAYTIANVNEARTVFGATDLAEIRTMLNVENDEAVVSYFNTHRKIEDYFLLYLLLETRLALGDVFLDKEVKPGEVYIYSATLVRNGKESDWGTTAVLTGSGNYMLSSFRPLLHSINTFDSSVVLSWKLSLKDADAIARKAPRSPISSDKEGSIFQVPYPIEDLRAVLYTNQKGRYQVVEKLIPELNITQDTLTFTSQLPLNPDEKIEAFLQTRDFVDIQGVNSDTAVAIGVTNRTAAIVPSIDVKAVTDALQISWAPLANKAYVTGVEIVRFDNRDVADTIARLSATDSVYIDYNVTPGMHYRYYVRARYLPMLNISQEVPAIGVGTPTVFSRPLPPQNLRAENVGGNVSLTWEGPTNGAFYGFFVYRGTSPNELSLIAGPVKQASYLDTAASLSGRSQYFYSVLAQNLQQDTSIHSDIASIVPDRKVETAMVNQIEFYYANEVLQISWNDIRRRDGAVTGFLLQRRKSKEKDFITITQTPLTEPVFEDTTIVPGDDPEYRVAAVNFKGDAGNWGNAATFVLAKAPIPELRLFYVRNTSDGVEVSWPPVVDENRKAYNVYRREASEMQLQKIGSTNADTYSFIDKNAKAGVTYVYSITVIENDGRESNPGPSKSVRRSKP